MAIFIYELDILLSEKVYFLSIENFVKKEKLFIYGYFYMHY